MKTLILLTFIFSFSCSDKITEKFSRPKNLPENAFLIESNKGSYWYHVIDVQSHQNMANIAIYDSVGNCISSKRFIMVCIITGFPILIEKLEKQIDHYDGEKIYIKVEEGLRTCWLQ